MSTITKLGAVLLAGSLAACTETATEPTSDASSAVAADLDAKIAMLPPTPSSIATLAAAITYNQEIPVTSFAIGQGVQGSTVLNGFFNSSVWEYYWLCGVAGDAVRIETHRTTNEMDPAQSFFLGTTNDNTGVGPFNGGPNMTWLDFDDDNNGIPHGVGGFFADPRTDIVLPATAVYTLAVYDFIGQGPAPKFEIHAAGHNTCSLSIDIKPTSSRNPINTQSKGVIPVAILGSASFDVTAVDVTTLSFGPGGAATDHDLTDALTYADHLRDVNSDGYTDLVSHYRTQEAGFSSGDTQGCITADLVGFPGFPWTGCDVVDVIK